MEIRRSAIGARAGSGYARSPRWHRWARWPARVAAALAGGVAVLYAGFGWYFADELNRSALDAAERRGSGDEAPYSLRVISIAGGAITLSVPAEPDVLLQEGTWGLQGENGGFAQIGAIRSREATSITRDYRLLGRQPIAAGERTRLVHEAFPADPFAALGLQFQDVTYSGPLGSYPAWLVEGSPAEWAVLVHGNGMTRADVMRLMGPIHAAGFTVLAITYRNDANAPSDPSGKLRYGSTEWSDVEAAVAYAMTRGARNIVLGGVSMGGGIVMSFLYHSSLASSVAAVVLDSPMLDFSRTVEYQAQQRRLPLFNLRLPGSLIAAGKWFAGVRYGVDWNAVDYLPNVSRLSTPILLFHGTADVTVPIATSAELAAARPDLVTYVVTPGAGHVDSWNLAPQRYDRYVESFLAARVPVVQAV